MNNTDYLKVVDYLNEKLVSEVQLVRMSGNSESLTEFLGFIGELAKLDVMSILQPNIVAETFDVINKGGVYNEHYYQKLVVDMIVFSNTMEGGWDSLKDKLCSSVTSLRDSQFIPTDIAERLDADSIKDPYIALAFLIKDLATSLLVKEARKNAK